MRHKSQACSHIAAQAMSARRDTRALPKPTRPALSRPLPTPRGAAGSSCREIPSGASSGDPGAVGKGVQPRRAPPVPWAVSGAIQGPGEPGDAAKGVCASGGAAPERAGDRSCAARTSGRVSSLLKVNN